MGKKYLNTKDGSIEQSILDVWQEAADMHVEGMDGRTKEYRSHRGKLESNRVKQENKKNSVKTEQPETLDGAGEHAFEVGTDRYREHTQLVTPGQIREFLEEMSDEELDNILEDADEEILEGFVTIMSEENVDEGIFKKAVGFLAKKAGSGIAHAAKRYGTTAGRAAGLKKKVAKKVQKKKDIASIAKSKKALKKDEFDHVGKEVELDEAPKNYYEIGGDRYDAGVVFNVYVNGKKVHDQILDGNAKYEYKGKKYDDVGKAMDAIAKAHNLKAKDFKRVEMEELDLDEASKLSPHLAKFFDKDGDLKKDVADRIAKGKEKLNIKDVTPKGYGPNEEVELDEKADLKKIDTGQLEKQLGLLKIGKPTPRMKDTAKRIRDELKSRGIKAEELDLDEDNMDLMRKAAKGAMQTIKFKDGKLKMDSFTASGIMAVYDKVNPKNKVSIEKMINSGTKAQIMKLQDLAMKASKGGRREEVELEEMEKENMTENLNLRDTIKNLWIEAASSAVNPNDREELDIDVKNSAKKMKRAKEPVPNVSEELDEASGDKEAYQKFFNATLKKFKVSSPADLKSDEEKKKFFDYIDKNWEGDNEKAEELIQLAKEFKVSSMREALAKVWGLDEGELPPALKKAIDAKKKDKEEKDEDKEIKGNKTLTGKKAAVVEIDPGLKTKK